MALGAETVVEAAEDKPHIIYIAKQLHEAGGSGLSERGSEVEEKDVGRRNAVGCKQREFFGGGGEQAGCRLGSYQLQRMRRKGEHGGSETALRGLGAEAFEQKPVSAVHPVEHAGDGGAWSVVLSFEIHSEVGEQLCEILAGEHAESPESETGGCSAVVGGIVEEKHIGSFERESPESVEENLGIRLAAVGFKRGLAPEEIVADVVPVLAEFLGDARIPHYGVGVGEQIYAVALLAQLFEETEPVEGNSGEKSVESRVDLLVGDACREVAAQLIAELRGCDLSLLDEAEHAGLRVVAEIVFGVWHAQFPERADAVVALYIHYHSSEVEEQHRFLFVVIHCFKIQIDGEIINKVRFLTFISGFDPY